LNLAELFPERQADALVGGLRSIRCNRQTLDRSRTLVTFSPGGNGFPGPNLDIAPGQLLKEPGFRINRRFSTPKLFRLLQGFYLIDKAG
jgi:hypothetical protein